MFQKFKRLKKYFFRHKKTMLLGCWFIVMTNLVALLAPWVLKHAIDDLKTEINNAVLLKYASLIVAVALVEGAFRFLMRKTMIGVSRHIEYDLRNDFFAHLQKMSQSFYREFKTGDLMARATNDLEAVRQVTGPAIMYSVNTLFSMVYFGVMIYIDAKLALLALLPFPLMALIVNRLAQRLNKAHREIQTQFAAITSKVQENLSGIRVVKAYVQDQGELRQFQKLNNQFIDLNLSMTKTRGLMMASMALLVGLGDVIVLWFGGGKVIAETLTLGELVAFFAYLGMLTWPMIALGWVINLFQQGAASMARLDLIFDLEPEINDGKNTDLSLENIRGDIEFKAVSFSYAENQVLKDINLTIKHGTTLALVGPTGSGKSTLINLIPRLLETQEGEVLLDGRPIAEIPLAVLRSSIGYVPQETFLFSDTIHANIKFGVESASLEQVEDAAEVSQVRADIHDFHKGFETMLGERGINLSGGQKQRTAIARAVISNPKILLLDDSLSAVDTYTEEAILKRLRDIMRERTSIIVSHRISTVKDADQIVFLEDGQIRESGTHHELLRKGGLYARLYEQQLLEEALESFDMTEEVEP